MREPSKDLVTALESEVMGEASFRTASYLVFNAGKKTKLKALWALEAKTKQLVLQHFEQEGIRLPGTIGLAIRSSLIGLLMPLLPWKTLMESFLKETEKFLVVFRRLHEEAGEADKALFRYLVDHELAIDEFARLELAGDQQGSASAVHALLQE